MVIIGNGGAAVHAIQGIRKNGFQGEINLFSDRIQPPYNPMLITYFLGGKIPLGNCYLFKNHDDFAKTYRVNVHVNNPVIRLDGKEQNVLTSQGEKIYFKSCLIASGASPVIPSIPGSKSKRVFTIRSIEEGIQLRNRILDKPKRVVVVGASMVGIKLVEIFAESGSEVYLVDLAPHVFSQAAHLICARMVEEQLEKQGIRLIMNAKVEGIEESRQNLKVWVSGSQQELEAELIVFCIGVKPNLDFIGPGDIEVDKGIVVDNRMRTSVSNIYAAGDAAQGLNLLNGKKEVIPLWANACVQGQTAGENMTGGNRIYPGSIPQNITHFFDVYFVSIGDFCNHDEVERVQNKNAFSLLFKRKGKIVGINLFSTGNHAVINSSGVIRNQLLKTFQYQNVKRSKNDFHLGFMTKFLNLKHQEWRTKS